MLKFQKYTRLPAPHRPDDCTTLLGGLLAALAGADEQQKQHVLSSGDPLGSLLNPTATSFGFTMISAGGGVIASPTSQFNTDN